MGNVSGDAAVSRRLRQWLAVAGHCFFRGRYRDRGRFLPFCIRPVPRKQHTLAGCTIHVQFLVAKRHSDLFFDPDPDTDTDPAPDFLSAFLCLSLANIN